MTANDPKRTFGRRNINPSVAALFDLQFAPFRKMNEALRQAPRRVTFQVGWGGGILRAVKLNVFACKDGFLLSSDCMLAPRNATRAHWPVSALLGVVDCEELPADLCSFIEQDIDDKQFSFVSTAEAFRVGIPGLASKNPPPQMA